MCTKMHFHAKNTSFLPTMQNEIFQQKLFIQLIDIFCLWSINQADHYSVACRGGRASVTTLAKLSLGHLVTSFNVAQPGFHKTVAKFAHPTTHPYFCPVLHPCNCFKLHLFKLFYAQRTKPNFPIFLPPNFVPSFLF